MGIRTSTAACSCARSDSAGQGARAGHLGAALRRRQRTRAGLTLIEVMVVLAVVAMAVGGITVGLRTLTRTHLRSSCMTLASAARYAYQRALTRGTTVRLTLDFESDTFSLTETEDPISLVHSDSVERTEAAEDEEGDPGAALSPWEAAAKKIDNPDAIHFGKPPFDPIRSDSGKVIERFAKHPLGRNIQFHKLVVAHEEEPRVEGKVDLFFFPNGTTQHSVIQLEDGGETVYSVEIHPLTGHARMHDIPYEPEVLYDDPDEDMEETSELEGAR